MRRMIVAALAVLVVLIAGCQDNEARTQNAKLQAELDAMKAKQGDKGNDALVALLANQNKSQNNDALERKLTSLAEDINAGQDKLEKQIEDSDTATGKRMDDLEDRIKKVSDLQTTITALKGMVESLESKVKAVDPNEVLNAQKELINKDADLRVEKDARAKAEADLAEVKKRLDAAQAEVETLKAQVNNLQGADISSHPQYVKLQKANNSLEHDLKVQSAKNDALQKRYDELVKTLQNGSNPPKETPAPKVADYDFSGTVTEVSKGSRPDGPSYLLVGKIKGTVPVIGTELVVLDAKSVPVCTIKVVRLYHVNDKDEMPVDEVGCQTVDEKDTRPVAKGDTVAWIKKDTKSGTDAGSSDDNKGSAGGN